ncbi:hypothetical protein M406DRAFT_285642 [Cryphonectria parasitica EP155]|uniref:GAR domain-containing protein n=1 Tax=Cryphonectria parasitica (strain ATCC 38755 / EP155) TaxID=660469 RepID=A0A9P5CTZ2_CRYP1|nr:uncharacterized protein M406DRAFT_285642 [Cryphonectria parasitica EP155]KAF3770853.1 hypothetical protein M406DRAFT_285642 [Cryphonectria parasitica EP155]
MTESPSIHPPPPGARLLFAGRPSPSASRSSLTITTTQRPQSSDDFISLLSPLTAVDTFRAPTGPLKACMDAATQAERSFAMRAAVASKNIYEWLDELRDWPWPAQGGAGFLAPAPPTDAISSARGRSGSLVKEAQHYNTPTRADEPYIGSLPESDVTRYETRLDQIQAELDRLEIEEIKSHVLHNHIMPLSRPGEPGSPTLERQLGLVSLASYTKMDDMTAVITATVVQALPNLSKLIRLMSIWSVRLTVLRRIPSWLDAVADAESAVQTGWATIRPGTASQALALSAREFEVMRLVLDKKVATAAQSLDFMLDTLEGRDDILPDEMLDRMEAVERDFSEWIAACERKMRDAELAALKEPATPRSTLSKSSTGGTQARQQDPSMTPELLPVSSSGRSPHTPPRETRSMSLPLSDMPPVPEDPEDEDEDALQTPLTSVYDSTPAQELGSPIILSDPNGEEDHHMRQQIAEILENIPAKIQLSSKATFLSHLNPPDLQLPYTKPRGAADKSGRSRSTMSSRASTPAFMLAPVARSRQQRANQDIKMYHLSRANGEAPIKLFIRCVGESGERVMVRVGGGWADLGEYLKEYAIHHGRRSNRGSEQRLEVRDVPRSTSSMSSRTSASPPARPGPSPQSRPGSAVDVSPIYVKKTRKASAGEELLGPRLAPQTPIAYGAPRASEPSSVDSVSGSTGRSRSSSRLSWTEEESSLGMAGPRGSRKEIPIESLEWVESIKNKVRAASAGSDIPRSAPSEAHGSGKFGELGKVGGTKRVFRKAT